MFWKIKPTKEFIVRVFIGIIIVAISALLNSCNLNKSNEAHNGINTYSDEIGNYRILSWRGRGAIGGSRYDKPLIRIEERYYIGTGQVRFVAVVNDELSSQEFATNNISIVALDINQGTNTLASQSDVNSVLSANNGVIASKLYKRNLDETDRSKLLCGVLRLKYNVKDAKLFSLNTCNQGDHIKITNND